VRLSAIEHADESLARLAVDDDFALFYAEAWPALASLATAIIRDTVAGREVAQEAMVRVYAKWGSLREPFPWSLRVARNLSIDELRRRGREISFDSPPDASVAPTWGSTAVHDAVMRLPQRLRDVVLLHYLADRPIAEVATIIRRPIGTVKRRLHDARTLLASDLGDTNGL
jgi:RNA polymerase sigma factor (sigma-70 family)